MQIVKIVLYGRSNDIRELELRPGEVNIITGRSRRGKSALIEIVDYCLGSSECLVPEGVIAESVSWFGVILDFGTSQMFVARRNPDPGRLSTNEAYIQEGQRISEVPVSPISSNTTIDAIKDAIASRIGLRENDTSLIVSEYRTPTEATIRNALVYCFQSQAEVASPSLLFHKQGDTYVEQAIKDTLPFFLGALPKDQLSLQRELSRAKKKLRECERDLAEALSIKGEGMSKGTALIAEAMQVGLLEPSTIVPSETLELIELLKHANAWHEQELPVTDNAKINDYSSMILKLEDELNEVTHQIAAAESFVVDEDCYAEEARAQELRLESINLFDHENLNDHQCPFCENVSDTSLVDLTVIHKSIDQLRSNLERVTKARPRINEYIADLEAKREQLKEQIQKTKTQLNGAIAAAERVKSVRDFNTRAAIVKGRIDLWLESVEVIDNSEELANRVAQAKQEVSRIESNLAPEDFKERFNSILNRIGNSMSRWAEKLNLEHSENPIRFDPKRLSPVIDREDRAVPLARIGSGANWVGFHLITLFAFHKHFVKTNRPVPRFLFLDQPSQVYYPRDKDDDETGSLDNIPVDDDRKALRRMYDTIFEFIAEMDSGMQIIILDHASIPTEEFQSAVVEEWRGDNALIPKSWIPPTS